MVPLPCFDHIVNDMSGLKSRLMLMPCVDWPAATVKRSLVLGTKPVADAVISYDPAGAPSR